VTLTTKVFCLQLYLLFLLEELDLNTRTRQQRTGVLVEWILVHRHFTCKSKNPRILARLIILEQSLKYKSYRVLKMIPNSIFLFCFLTSYGSTQ
jgi:hypothetical protein